MGSYYTQDEESVLDTLRSSDILTFEQLSMKHPELTWNELFHIVDILNRRGEIILRREGYQYGLQMSARGAPREAHTVLD